MSRKRSRMSRRKSRRLFSRTAMRTRRKNISALYRGGIRL